MRNTVLTEIYVGGAAGWVDASTDARQEDGHTITRVEGDPGRCDFTLSNPDGRWSPRNPLGPYFGQLARNTPVRVGLELFRDDFDGPTLAGSWGAGWANAISGGTVDQPAQFGRSGGSVFHRVPAPLAFRHSYYTGRKFADCEVRTSFTMSPADVVGGVLEPANVMLRVQDINLYYMARIEVTTAEAVRVSIHHSTAGVIAAAVVITGAVYAGQPWEAAASCVGDRLAVKVWQTGQPEPRDWQLTATDSRITAPGYVGIRSGVGPGNTNAAPVEFRYYNVRVIDRRAVMEMSEPVPQANAAGTDAWVSVTANGITRRLGQGVKPLSSALTRRIPATLPVGWWPLEDGKEATHAASGIPGAAPLTAADPLAAGFGGAGPDGAAAGLEPRNGAAPGLAGPVPLGVTPDSFTVSTWVRGSVEDPTKVALAQPFGWNTGTERWQLLLQSGTEDAISGVVDPNVYRVTLSRFTDAGSGGFAPFTVRVLDGAWHLVSFGLQQQGANIAGWLYIDGVQRAAGTVAGTLRAPETARVLPGPPVNLNGYALAHLQVHNGPFSPDEVTAGAGFAGEAAADRFARLCAEQGVAALITRGPDPSAAMGPQRPATLLDLLQECADVDGGIRGEAREHLALTYVCRGALYNPTPVRLTYAHLVPPLLPVPDDKGIRNDVRIKRTGGASAHAVLESGPLSVQPPPAGVGTYDTAPTLNVASDAQLPDVAGWHLHVGTWDEARYPGLRINLAAPVWAADIPLADTVTALEAGRALELSALPVWLPPGPVALQVRGSVEHLGQYTRSIDFTLQPAGPYTVARSGAGARAAASTSTLALELTAAAVNITITGERWTTDPVDFPLSVRVGGPDGEIMTVTALAGAGPYTATVVRGVNGLQRAWPAGARVSVWPVARAAW